MRTLKHGQFLKLPAGVLFRRVYESNDAGALEVKGDTVDRDFFCAGVLCGDPTYRDGTFDEGQKYAVLDSDDVRNLIVELLNFV